MKLLLVGSRYLPYRHEGDKNFWLELVDAIKSEVNEIHILSLANNDMSPTKLYEPNVWLHTIRPIPFPPLRSKFGDDRMKSTNNYVSRSLSFLKAIKRMGTICSQYDIDVIQFMENYGPATLLTPLSTTRVPLSAIVGGYYPNVIGYKAMLKLWGKIFTRIVPSTEAMRQKLVEIGIPKERISERISWGVDTTGMRRNPEQRETTRKKLDVNAESRLVLWSGFLQRTSLREFRYSVEVAQQVLSHPNHCHFIFCFKRPHFEKRLMTHSRDKLKVISTETNEEFLQLVNASDIFLSPYLAEGSVLSTPLTWLECMAYGVPIITTDIAGATEVIIHGHNGYIAHSKEETVNCILRLVADDQLIGALAANARETVCEMYDISHIATQFLRLWCEIKG